MNLGEAKKRALQLMSEYSVNGNIIAATDNNQLDYTLRFNSFADIAQKEIATIKKINAVYKVSQNPLVNQLPNPVYMFDVVQHLDTDLIYTAQGSKSYYFEVDNISTIYIEEQIAGIWTILTTLTQAIKPQGYNPFYGLITASDANNYIRIRFSGNYPYNARGIALYKYSFPTVDDVPKYTRYNIYSLPSDFFELKEVVFKGNQSDGYPYVKTSDYFWENRRNIAINYYNKGEYSVFYYKYPTTINADTLDTYEFEVDTEAQELIPFFMAAHAIIDESQSIGTLLLNEYQNKLTNLNGTDVYGETEIQNVTGW